MLARIRIFLEMIKFEHTIFALPFAFLGAFLAAGGVPLLRQCAWILAAMVGARTAAMGFNRIVDRRFDAMNPRTKERAIPKGEISVRDAWLMVAASSLLFFVAAYMLNPLAFKLSPLVLGVTLAYSYTKRFTAWCHLFLGFAIGLAPSAGWIAVRGVWGILPGLITLGVMFWVAGFDILYACMDAEFDRKAGLHSIPAWLGVRRAFLVSAAFHLVAFFIFCYVGFMARLNWIYFAGLAAVSIFFVLQRIAVKPNDLSRMDMAFFTLNGAVSMVMFFATAASLLLG